MAGAALVVSVLAGCEFEATTCTAVGYGTGLTVRLDDTWPEGPLRTVEVDCGENCQSGPAVTVDADGVAVFSLSYPPIPFTVRVLEEGVVVVEESVAPDLVRVGGTAECGGPTEAEVVVPAP